MKFICPNCAHEAELEECSKLDAENSVHFKLYPKPGSLMTAKTVGGTLSALEGLLRALAKEHNMKADVLVESVSTENGAIDFALRILNH